MVRSRLPNLTPLTSNRTAHRFLPRPLLVRTHHPLPDQLWRNFHDEEFIDPYENKRYVDVHFYVGTEYRQTIEEEMYYGEHELHVSRHALEKYGTLHLGDEWTEGGGGAETPINHPKAYASAYYEAWNLQAPELREPGKIKAMPYMKRVPDDLVWSVSVEAHDKMIEYAASKEYKPFWDLCEIKKGCYDTRYGYPDASDKENFFNEIYESRPIWLPRLMEEIMTRKGVKHTHFASLGTQEIAWTPLETDPATQRRNFLSCITYVKFRDEDDEYVIDKVTAGTPEAYAAFVTWWEKRSEASETNSTSSDSSGYGSS